MGTARQAKQRNTRAAPRLPDYMPDEALTDHRFSWSALLPAAFLEQPLLDIFRARHGAGK
jgi:hypothetical protein